MYKKLYVLAIAVLSLQLLSACSFPNTTQQSTTPTQPTTNTNSGTQDVSTTPDDSSTDTAKTQSDNLQNLSVNPNDTISSPLTLSGEARRWYFEGSFPVRLEDTNGNILYRGIISADGDWMQDGFVPFRTTITFTKPGAATGYLILSKDNPSGLPELDESVKIPVTFAQE